MKKYLGGPIRLQAIIKHDFSQFLVKLAEEEEVFEKRRSPQELDGKDTSILGVFCGSSQQPSGLDAKPAAHQGEADNTRIESVETPKIFSYNTCV